MRQEKNNPFLSEKRYLKNRLKELESLDRFTGLMMTSFNIKDVIDMILDYVLKTLPVDVANIAFFFEDHIFIKTDSKIDLNRWIVDDIKKRIIESMRKEEECRHLMDKLLFEWEQERDAPHKITLHPSARKTEISLPLTRLQKKLGMIGGFCFSEGGLKKRERRFLSQIAKKASLGLDNVYRHTVLEKLSRIDPLTQVYNHRVFHETLEREFNRYRRYKNSLSLIMLDVDRILTILKWLTIPSVIRPGIGFSKS